MGRSLLFPRVFPDNGVCARARGPRDCGKILRDRRFYEPRQKGDKLRLFRHFGRGAASAAVICRLLSALSVRPPPPPPPSPAIVVRKRMTAARNRSRIGVICDARRRESYARMRESVCLRVLCPRRGRRAISFDVQALTSLRMLYRRQFRELAERARRIARVFRGAEAKNNVPGGLRHNKTQGGPDCARVPSNF